MYGCKSPGRTEWSSILDPSLPKRRRCPKSILNPDTDEFDPQIAEVIAMSIDLEEWGGAVRGLGLDEPCPVIDALRFVRNGKARMTAMDMKKRQELASRGQ